MFRTSTVQRLIKTVSKSLQRTAWTEGLTLNMRKEFVRSRVTSRRIDTGNAERLVLKKTTVVNHFTNGQETNEGVKAKYFRKSARNPGTQHNKRRFVDENHRAHSSADKQNKQNQQERAKTGATAQH